MKKITITCILVLIFASCGNKPSHEAPQVDSTVVAVDSIVISEPTTITDVDGNVYHAVTIGDQVWMLENLKVTHYQNGDPIPNITDGNKWAELSSGGYCDYENSPIKGSVYGHLYNWYAVDDSRNLAPKGWHIPSVEEWSTLIKYIGNESLLLKSPTAWNINKNVKKSDCFMALPSGMRTGLVETNDNGKFLEIGTICIIWSSSPSGDADGIPMANILSLDSESKNIDNTAATCYTNGCSVRCIKNSTSNSSYNSWLIGIWEVQTDAGLMNLTILDSQNATFLGDGGTYTIDNGVLKWRDKSGIVSPFTMNYSNQTLKVDGSNYVLRKRNSPSNNSQTNCSSSNQSRNSYKQTYRENFSSRSAVFEFLATHTFRGSDGTRITYDMSTLSLTFSSGKSALFTNVELLGYNQNIARIRAICTNVSGYSATFTLNASNGTVTDNDGTLYRAVN